MPCCPTSSRSVGARPGVRLAIGAPPSRIITLVIGQALKLVLAGMACGLALAVPMAFVMRATFVAKVTATDPMVFLPTISVLLGVGILAAAVPPLRAFLNRSDCHTAAGIGIAFARWCRTYSGKRLSLGLQWLAHPLFKMRPVRLADTGARSILEDDVELAVRPGFELQDALDVGDS